MLKLCYICYIIVFKSMNMFFLTKLLFLAKKSYISNRKS